jgi:quinol monooxygenase YgiN
VRLIVAGTFRAPPDRLHELRPHMTAMITASGAEEGCAHFTYAQDILEPGLIRVFEVWRDRAAFEEHLATPHLTAWRAVWEKFGVHDRRLIAYEVASQGEV